MTPLRMMALVVAMIGFGSSTVLAHPGHAGHSPSDGGFFIGLAHPLLGFDHLLAMVAVGLLGAQMSGRAIWALPGAFLTNVIFGGIVGMSPGKLPAVEYGIAISIILLGLAMALNLKLNLDISGILVGAFGFIHGFAHGTEMPSIANPVLYATGFIATTLILHVSGVLIGQSALRKKWGTSGLRFSGGAIAAIGVWFAFMI